MFLSPNCVGLLNEECWTVGMLSSAIQASLEEVLEVRGGLLKENEIWIVLKSSVIAIGKLFKEGQACSKHTPRHVVMPDTLMLCHDGQIRISVTPVFNDIVDNSECRFIPLECSSSGAHSEETIEKIYVFGLGVTLLSSSDCQRSSVNTNLFYTLDAMCHDDVTSRPSLKTLFSICENNLLSNDSCSRCIKSLHGTVFGSNFSLSRSPELAARTLEMPEDLSYVQQSRSGLFEQKTSQSSETEVSDVDSESPPLKSSSNIVHEHLNNHFVHQNEPPLTESKSTAITDQAVRGEASSHSVESIQVRSVAMETKTTQTCNEGTPPESSLTSHQVPSMSINGGVVKRSHITGQSSRPQSEAVAANSDSGFGSSKNGKNIHGVEIVRTELAVNLFLPDVREADETSLRCVEVMLLNGNHLNIICRFDCTGRQLYDFVTYHLALSEPSYFGLTFIHDGEHFFIDADAKLHKMAPVEWKGQSKKSYRQTPSFKTYFHVKFFLDDLSFLRQEASVHLLYLQLRRDIVEDRLSCTEDQILMLAGLALRAEYGDLVERVQEAPVDHYVSPRILNQLNRYQASELIVSHYLQISQVSKEDAEQKFIKIAMQLPEYGVHFYDIQKTQKNSGKQQVWLGICVNGVLVAEHKGNRILVTESFKWQNIEKISFNQHRFSISLRQSDAVDNGKLKVTKLCFRTESYKKGKYLLKFCTESHHFQMMVRMSQTSRQIWDPEAATDNMIHRSRRADDSHSQTSREENDFRHSSRQPSLTVYDAEEGVDERSSIDLPHVAATYHVHQHDDTSYHHQSQRPSPLSEFNQIDLNEDHQKYQSDLSKRHLDQTDQTKTTYLDDIPPPVVDDDVIPARAGLVRGISEPEMSKSGLQFSEKFTSKATIGSRSSPVSQASYPLRPLAIVERAKSTASSKKKDKISIEIKRQLLKLVLSKSASTAGFGFGIVRDQTTTPSLLRIAQIVPGGVADQDGRLKTGDKLIKVNGKSVAGLTQRDAVELVRMSGNLVKIVVLRSKSNEKLSNSDSLLPMVEMDGRKSRDDFIGSEHHWPIISLQDISHDVPKMLTDEWMDYQPYLSMMESSIRYSGARLKSIIDQLHTRLSRDDPGEEFKSLHQGLETAKCTAACEEKNRTKNRYRNVLPYDDSRVYLASNEDYVNASLVSYTIPNTNLRLQYIATQDPLPNTVADFWQMVWEQHVPVIIAMHSSTSYLPEDDGMHRIVENRFRITLSNKQCLRHFNVSNLQLDDLEAPGSSRLIIHVESTLWPEHGVPESSSSILLLRRLMRTLIQDGDGPVLVHCLTGIGRTATLLAIDIALTLIENDCEVKCEQILGELRQQRPTMIQTKSLYCFVYQTVLAALESLSTSYHSG